MRISPLPLPSDFDVTQELHTLLGAYMKDREADVIVLALRPIIKDLSDGPKLSGLIQEWLGYQ